MKTYLVTVDDAAAKALDVQIKASNPVFIGDFVVQFAVEDIEPAPEREPSDD